MSEENIEINAEVAPERTKRLRWIDQARGFIMVYLVWTLALPGELTQSIPFLKFLFDHPADTAETMNIFDIGTPAFMFIVGLSLSISFWRNAEKKSVGNSVLKVFLRFGALFLVGYFIQIAWEGYDFTSLWKVVADPVNGDMVIIWWDVIIALGAIGMTALPFIFIKNPYIRTAIAYGWMLIYQILLVATPYFRPYAIHSIHGGVFASLFTFTSVTVIGTALGDFMYSDRMSKKNQYLTLGIFGAVNVLLAIGLNFINGWYWNKEQATFTFALMSIGVITLGSLLFVVFDEVLNWKLNYLVMFGMNPLFSYCVAEILYQLPSELFDINALWLKMVIWGAVIIVVSLLNWLLFRKKKRIRTEWVTLGFFLFLLIASFLI